MTRALLFSVLVVPSALMVACFEDDVPVAIIGPNDGGSEAASPEGGEPDASDAQVTPDGDVPDSKSEAAPGDATEPPPGSATLTTGKDFTVWGVTSDGYAIYATAPSAGDSSTSTMAVYAAPIAGGAAITIDTVSQDTLGVVAGPLVELFVGADVSATAGTIETWTAKGGLHTLSTDAYVFLGGSTSNNYGKGYSPDFSSIAYLDHYDGVGQTADAYVANIDGTGAKLLQSNVPNVGGTDGSAQLMFSGGAVVLAYVTPSDSLATIESFAAPAWSSTGLATGIAGNFVIGDPSGAHVLFDGPSGLEAVATSGGAPMTIDPSGTAAQALFTSDGTSVLYTSGSGDLRRSPVDSPDPMTLVSANVGGLLGLSPDNRAAFVYETFSSFPDLYEASATIAGPLVQLSSSATATLPGESVAIGSLMTNDFSHVLFYTDLAYTTFFKSSAGIYVGTLKTSAVGSSASVTLATSSYTVYASGKSKVVFDDGFGYKGASMPTVDLKSVDTAAGASPGLVVSQANYGGDYGSFFLSPDGTEIVYATNTTSTGGVYVTPVP
jgi:hypothetical protein